MSKEKNVIKYYVLCNKLKNELRGGWLDWSISRDRIESVAEHIYSTQMLAIAMQSEYKYNINLEKVLVMLAIHELEEILIGDVPITSKDYSIKKQLGHEAVKKVLESLSLKKEIEEIVLEFDNKETEEAKFAYLCDKLECDLQAKIYDEEGCFSLDNQSENKEYIEYAKEKEPKSFTEIWYTTDSRFYRDDKNFQDVFNYARDNNILD